MNQLKRKTVNNIGQFGLNTDIAATELDVGFLTEGRNFRIESGSIRASGGMEVWSTSGTPINLGHVFPVKTTSADFWLAMGRNAVYVFDGTTWTDITSAAGYGALGADDELNWTVCRLGSIPIINNPQHVPEYWSPQSAGQIMQPLQFDAANTWAALGYSCQVMRSHKNFLFALNLQEGLNELPNTYRWSHPADINGLPFTWDETDVSAIASKESIGGDGGVIVDGRTLRDAFVIYAERAIHVLDFVGGEFVFRRRELSSTAGLLNKNCIIEVKGSHFILGDGDIVRNTGNMIDSIIHNRIRKRLNSNMSVDYFDRAFAVRNNIKKEVWFCVPEDGAAYPNMAYIYNWKDDSWSLRELPDNLVFAGYGVKGDSPETWDTVIGNWNEHTDPWGSNVNSPLSETIVGARTDTSLVDLDPSDLGSASSYDTLVERTGFPLETEVQINTVLKIYPRIESSMGVYIQIGSQDYADGPVKWEDRVYFDPNTDRHIDYKSTGSYLCWRVQADGMPSFLFSGMTIEYVNSGLR